MWVESEEFDTTKVNGTEAEVTKFDIKEVNTTEVEAAVEEADDTSTMKGAQAAAGGNIIPNGYPYPGSSLVVHTNVAVIPVDTHEVQDANVAHAATGGAIIDACSYL